MSLALAKTSFLNKINYRFAALIWILNGFIGPLILMSAWLAVQESRQLALDKNQIISYYLLAILIIRLTQTWSAERFSESIKSGKFSQILISPIHYLTAQLGRDLAGKAIRVISLTPFIVPAFYFFREYLSINTKPINLIFFLVSIILAYIINFILENIVGTVAFWLEFLTGPIGIYGMVNAFFNGSLVPLALMPTSIETLAKQLPFRYIISFPIEILTHQLTTQTILTNFLLELIWILVLLTILKTIQSQGIKKYTAVGG